MEQVREAKAPAQVGVWDPVVKVAVKAAVMEQERPETVFVQTVGKESLIN
jgi:hypothetical protein